MRGRDSERLRFEDDCMQIPSAVGRRMGGLASLLSHGGFRIEHEKGDKLISRK